VWLTRIEVSGLRDDFAIQGRALRADLLSEYIKMLRKEEAFRGKPIGTLSLHEREIDPGGGQSAASGPAQPARVAAAVPVAAVPAAAVPGPQSTRAGVRVVEFMIGTSLAKGPEAAGK